MGKSSAALAKEIDAIAEEKIATPPVAALWLRARDEVEELLGRPPSNEDMVRHARSPRGKAIRHLFPFNDLAGSAFRHWVSLASAYTRRATIVFASDPGQAPTRVRALHVVNLGNGRSGIVPLDRVANEKRWSDQIIEDARKSAESFAAKYENLNKALKDPRLVKAIELALEQAKALGDGEEP